MMTEESEAALRYICKHDPGEAFIIVAKITSFRIFSDGRPTAFTPVVTTVGVDEPSANDTQEMLDALAALQALGAKEWPTLTKEQQFARAFEANPTLAARAHRRPLPTTSYAWPRYESSPPRPRSW